RHTRLQGDWSSDVCSSDLEAMASANPIDTDVGMAVAFTCSKTDWSTPFGPYEFAWDFGDGGTAAGDTATHRYDASGTMTATCSEIGRASCRERVEGVVGVR